MARVLLIEPDFVLAKTYEAALEQSGHAVTIAHEAQKAIHAMDDQQPDIVLLELQLVGHSGTEFMYEFRSYPEWQHIPIVLCTLTPPTALELTEDIFERLNVTGYLYKPSTSLRKLVQAVEKNVVSAAV
jgi:CheY-like chemotaxis protein